MLGEALRYPLESGDRVPTLIIGGGLLAIPLSASLLAVLIGPLALVAVLVTLPASLVVQGYLLRVLGSAADGEPAAPSFTNWGTLLVDGLKLLVVNLVYSLVVVVPAAALLLVAGVGAGAVSDGTASDASLAALGTVSLLLVAGIGLLALALSYVLPAAMTNLAVEGRLGAAFEFRTIRRVVFTSDYFVGVLLGFVVGSVGGAVGGSLSILVVGLPLLFYAQVVTYYCFGRGFAEARASMAPATETVQ